MIHCVSCVWAEQRFFLSPDVLGLRIAGWRYTIPSDYSCDVISPVWLATQCHVKCLETLRTTTAVLRLFTWFNLMALCNSYVNYMLRTDINITETTYSCQF